MQQFFAGLGNDASTNRRAQFGGNTGAQYVGYLERRHRLFDVLAGILVILQLAGEVALIRGQVEVAVAAQAEQNRAGRPSSRAASASSTAARMACDGFGRGQNALGAGELQGRFEHRESAYTPWPRCSPGCSRWLSSGEAPW